MSERRASVRETDKVIVLSPEERAHALEQIAWRLSELQAFAVEHPEVLSFALREEFHTRLIQFETQAREWPDGYLREFADTLARLETKFHVENARHHMPMRIRAVQDTLNKIKQLTRGHKEDSRRDQFEYLALKIANLLGQLDWALAHKERDEASMEIDYFERETGKLKRELAQLEKAE